MQTHTDHLASTTSGSRDQHSPTVARKRQRFSDVLSQAVEYALDVYRDTCESELFGDVNAATWRAMYEAQCSATDEFSKRASAKSDKALTERVAELEAQIAAVNRSFESVNFKQFALISQAQALTERVTECAGEVPVSVRKSSDALANLLANLARATGSES